MHDQQTGQPGDKRPGDAGPPAPAPDPTSAPDPSPAGAGRVPELLSGRGRQVRRSALTAPLLVLVIAFSFQTGSALATKIIAAVGVVEALWFRTAIAAVLLVAVRPRSLRLPARGERLPVLLLTFSLFAMNLSFYGAIAHAPIGVVVSIEFLGPLAVAVAGSRRPLDFLWIALAAGGVVLLAGPTGSVGAVGVVLSLSAALWWALYLVFGRRAVRSLDPMQVTTLMLVGSSLLLTPLLLVTGFSTEGFPGILLLGAAVAVLSSAFPYFLELLALRLVRAHTYSVLLSLEPAVAALAGFLVVGQRLSPIEVAAIAAVVVAAGGASWHARAGTVPDEVPAAP